MLGVPCVSGRMGGKKRSANIGLELRDLSQKIRSVHGKFNDRKANRIARATTELEHTCLEV